MNDQNPGINPYLRTKIMTASPEELRLLLLDGAIRFAIQARDGLVEKDFERSFNGFDRCRSIVIELISSMRPEVDPELCAKVGSLYTFIYTELLESGLYKDVPRLEKVIELLQFERETWAILMSRLSEERSGSAGAPIAQQAADQGDPAPRAHADGYSSAQRPALSVQG